MNKSSSRADETNASVFWRRVRQLLHAFADAGEQQSTNALQLFLGPNGGLMWTDAALVDRFEPCADVISIPEKSAAHIHDRSPAVLRPEEPVSPLFTPIEAPVES